MCGWYYNKEEDMDMEKIKVLEEEINILTQ